MEVENPQIRLAKPPWGLTAIESVVQLELLVGAIMLLQIISSTHDQVNHDLSWVILIIEALLLASGGLVIIEAWIKYFKSKNHASD